MEQKELDDARVRISNELAQFSVQSAALTSVSSTATANGAAAGTMASLQQLLATTQGQQADGRIVVHVSDILKGDASQDIVLQDGDSVAVPRAPTSVNVLGQVYHPTSVAVRHWMTVADYLYAAGGATPQGDVNRIMVIKVDGTVITRDGFREQQAGFAVSAPAAISDGLMSETLEAGDTVYVPESMADLQSVIRMGYWGDITKIVANSATGLAVIGLLATQI